MKRFLVFFSYRGGPIQVHPSHAGSPGKAETFFINTWGSDPMQTLVDVSLIYTCECPDDWSKTYIVTLNGEYYVIDENYSLTWIPGDVISGNYESL